MKFWLMVVLCMPGHPQCDVKWTRAAYPNVVDCKRAAEAVLYYESYPNAAGAFCEIAKKHPKTYQIRATDLP